MEISLSDLIVAGLEIFFIVWTIKNVKDIKSIKKQAEINENMKYKVETLYQERTDDFNKMESLKNRVEKLEKQIEDMENKNHIDNR